MLKPLGALLLALGGLALGLSIAEERRRRVRVLEHWSAALRAMAAELDFRLPTTEELLCRAAETAPAPVNAALLQSAEGLTALGETPFEEIWRASLTLCVPPLCGEDMDLLARLGGVLGRCDAQSQRAALEQTASALTRRGEHAREELTKNGRAFGTAGLSLGLFAAILLL